MHADSQLISAIGIAIFVAISWYALCFFISFMTGWHTLAQRFRTQAEPYGDTKTAGPFSYTVYMRHWSHYGGVIRLTAAADALYASVLFPFRIGHPSLCIPWSEIQFGRTKRLWWRYVVLTLGAQEKVPMRISERMARNLGILNRLPVP